MIMETHYYETNKKENQLYINKLSESNSQQDNCLIVDCALQ